MTVSCACICLLCSWPLTIRTNGVHLSHISSGTKWGRRPRTFSITGWQHRHTHTQDKHTNKNRPHTFMYTCTLWIEEKEDEEEEEEEEEGCMGWTFLSGDSYRTTSNSKSNLHNSPPSCTVYYTAFPSALQPGAPHSNSPLIRPQKQSYHFGEQTVECRDMIFLLLPFPLCDCWVLNRKNKSPFRKSHGAIYNCVELLH